MALALGALIALLICGCASLDQTPPNPADWSLPGPNPYFNTP